MKLQHNVIVIFAIIGVVIFFIGFYLYNYRVWTANFWSSTTPIATYPYRDEAPFVMIAGAVIAVGGVVISFILPSTIGGDEPSSVRICLGCGYPLPKNVKFCPRCGKTVESITVQSAHKHIH